MYAEIKKLADEAIAVQNKDKMDAALREISVMSGKYPWPSAPGEKVVKALKQATEPETMKESAPGEKVEVESLSEKPLEKAIKSLEKAVQKTQKKGKK